MLDKVLFATDFSDYSRKTLDCISGIPGIGQVLLLHVFDATHASIKGWEYDPEIRKAQKDLEAQEEELIGRGIRASARVEVITSGDVAGTIVQLAKQEKASLIVLGARGRGIIGSVLLGSVSRKVLQMAKTHVLIMRHRVVESFEGTKYEQFCPRILSKVLYPTDFSKPASGVATLLRDLGKVEKVIILHVVSRGEREEEIAASVHEAEERLETISGDLRGAGIDVRAVVRRGSPTDEINRLAEEEDVSLIAMGRHGEGWMKDLVVGSTAYMVTKRTKRPVLVVHPAQIPDGG
jgi:nucleotide-binding universal stress UspA family protein